jgi:hypothetical protein
LSDDNFVYYEITLKDELKDNHPVAARQWLECGQTLSDTQAVYLRIKFKTGCYTI